MRAESTAPDPRGGSSVTLIFYSIDKGWYRGTEPLLNLVAAAAQMSTFTHVEVAIGEGSGPRGEMDNVLRIFNDATGVELAQRTGKNPNYQYLQLGCSRAAESAMLAWARKQVGKPFSGPGMVRSVLWPRVSDGQSWFCAELVAACLQVGGLMSRDVMPGECTPKKIHSMFRGNAAVSANPFTLRREFGSTKRSGARHLFDPKSTKTTNAVSVPRPFPDAHTNPPRQAFRLVNQVAPSAAAFASLDARRPEDAFTLASLDMSRRESR
jgi:hypothetical protein